MQQSRYQQVTSFKECVKAGFLVTTTYPEKCNLPGKNFINLSQKKKPSEVTTAETHTIEESFKNLSYIVEGQKIDFLDGKGILPSSLLLKRPTSTFEITPTLILFDANNDSASDIFFLLSKVDSITTKNSLYLTGGITLNTGYSGLNALFISSSSASLPILIHKNGMIVVEYTDTHTTKKVKYFTLENTIIKEITP